MSGSGASFLYEISPSTGQAALIGAVSIPGVCGLSFNPTTNVLYGIVNAHYASPQIVTINTATGVGTTAAFTQPWYLNDLSFNPQTHDLYAVDNSPNTLYKIDMVTGKATTIGLTGLGNELGLAFTPEPATLGLLALGGLLMIRRRSA